MKSFAVQCWNWEVDQEPGSGRSEKNHLFQKNRIEEISFLIGCSVDAGEILCLIVPSWLGNDERRANNT